MDFSPYKPSPDENRTRQDGQQKKGKSKSTLSQDPFKTSSSYSPKAPGHPSPYQVGGAGPMSSSLLEEGLFSDGPSLGAASGGGSSSATMRVNKYETTLPIRVDLEAALTYLFPPLSGLLFLVLETQNDYVRFHAWQSSALFLFLMSLQFIMIFISNFLSWVLFFVGIGSILYLAYRAYLDGASLERYEVPYFGPMASEWVDTE